MQIQILKSKIHRVTVTEADLNYIGSITIDEELLEIYDLLTDIVLDHEEDLEFLNSVFFH